jgi:hypothetical protein
MVPMSGAAAESQLDRAVRLHTTEILKISSANRFSRFIWLISNVNGQLADLTLEEKTQPFQILKRGVIAWRVEHLGQRGTVNASGF